MPLGHALYAGITGLDVTSTAISVIGDNIANVNTPGFKERRAEFADLLSQTIHDVSGFSQLGAGAKTLKISRIFSQGNFESTQRPTDVAIQGRGYFLLDSPQGRSYSRAGAFGFDDQGLLVNAVGQRLQGFGIDPATGLSNGQLGDIQLSTSLAPPSATANVEVGVQLNANEINDPSVTGPFDPSNPGTSSHFQSSLSVFDSLGGAHPVTLFFTQTAAGSWAWNATLPPTSSATPPATPGDQFVVQGSGTLTFDANGLLTAPAGPATVNLALQGGAASPQPVALDFGPVAGGTADVVTTQFGSSASATSLLNQDGFASGQLQALAIDGEGYVSGLYSNNQTLNLAQLALATFPNVEGLLSTGDNNLIETRESGQALIGAPQTGNLGTLRSSSLELSNVDLAEQFVRLIVNQRAFQANTRTISVTNELLASLVSLGQ